MECITCEINAGRQPAPGGTVYEDGHWLVEHGISLLVRGYMVLKPKRHVHEIADLLPDETASLGVALQRLLAAMRAAFGPERIYVCSFAETVHHLHFHVIPRYAGMPGLGPNLMADLFAGRWSCGLADAEEAAEQVRAALRSEDNIRGDS